MLTIDHMREIVSEITYRDWRFTIGDDDGHPWLQVEFDTENNFAPFDLTTQRGRKWRLSRFMCKGEVVQTALAAVLAAEEHETREGFRYRGAPIFDGHYDVDALVEFRRDPTSRQFRPKAA